MGTSVSRRFFIGMGLTTLLFTVIATVAVFVGFERELERRQIGFLAQYVAERTDNVGRRFTGLITLQRSAIEALAARAPAMSLAEARRVLAADTSLRKDGTRRSVDRLFDGYVDAEGGRVYGVGAFIGAAGSLTPDETKIFAAAFPIVARFGQAAHSDYDNFYFFGPKMRLVMFGPDRPDRLLFYRKQAPANLDISGEEMSRFITPTADPLGETRCTSLQRLVQDSQGTQRVASACITPAYVGGKFVGAFGSSLRLDLFLNSVVSDRVIGGEALVMRSDGELIAAPRARLAVGQSEEAVSAYERSIGLKNLAQRLARLPAFGVVRSANGSDLIAYGRLKGPNWYLLIRYPAAAAAWSAAKSASWVLIVGVIGAALQTLVLLRLARSAIVRPLEILAASSTGRRSPAAAELCRREDEIGILARSLEAERERADELLSSLEERVRRRTADLERANAELEKANTEKSRFLANMSHELRTPLNGVVALSETLVGEQTTPRNVELAELIVASGRLLEQVLSDILDFSKIEAGEMNLEARPFDLATVVSRVAELHKASARAKGIELSWRVDPSAAGAFVGDAVRITQVLSNLLSNAVKFTEAGSVALEVRREAGEVLFSVTDTGIGFDEKVRARLFTRFEQADVSIRRRFGGTGLGLAICRSLVELMGGRIDASSTPGAGSVFSVALPLAVALSPEESDPEEEDGVEISFEGLRVLLAEDHPTNRRVIQLILETVGADLQMVENGRLALEALEGSTFDVILMDMQMPELDGLSATQMIRERELRAGAARTPIIMLTANAMDEHVRASGEAGADRHIAKPVHAKALIEAIAQLIARGEAAPEEAAA